MDVLGFQPQTLILAYTLLKYKPKLRCTAWLSLKPIVKNKFILLIVLLASPAILFAQQKFSISGYVKDAFSGESLIGSTVIVKELGKGVNTNEYGFYSISLPAGKYQIVASYLGFKPISDTINLNKNIKRNFFLKTEKKPNKCPEL